MQPGDVFQLGNRLRPNGDQLLKGGLIVVGEVEHQVLSGGAAELHADRDSDRLGPRRSAMRLIECTPDCSTLAGVLLAAEAQNLIEPPAVRFDESTVLPVVKPMQQRPAGVELATAGM